MFEGLLKRDQRIYGVTAANAEESSWAYYCETGTCLGDEFSVKWMEDSDKQGDLSKETLAQQFKRVQKAVEQSHVTHYGDLTFSETPVAEYQGERPAEPEAKMESSEEVNEFTRVLSYNVPMHAMQMKLQNAYSPLDQQKFDVMKKGRNFVDTVNEFLAEELEEKHGLPYPLLGNMEKLVNHDCYKTLVEAYNAHCFNVAKHTYALRSLFLFVNACHHLQEKAVVDVTPVYETIANFCKSNVADHPFLAIL